MSAPVEPGPALTGPERARYARQLALPGFGETAQRRLRAARVAVVGAGGLGSPVISYLAAAGVGALVVVDDDVVEASNLQRQVLHGVEDLGRAKADSAARAVHRLDPGVVVEPVRERLTDANADRLLAGCDLVVDGADNFATRYAVADACARLGLPEVFGSVLRFDAQVGVFWPGRGATYRDVFPAPPPAGSVASCAEAGVLGALCGVVGSVMAVEAVKVLTGTGRPLVDRLLVLDALTMSWRAVRVRAAQEGAAPAPAPAPAPEPEEPLPADAVVAPRELARLLAAGEVLLVDVRTPAERELAALPGAVPVPLAQVLDGTADLPRDRPVVLHCRSGARSELAVRALRARGRADAAHLDGGLLAWAAQVDPSLPVA
ncbi:adenylyltransferase and sulfurtransferase [Quadrisphaera sp. DSM 44207]|nr:ThiF family adenylyltransferase [Quadrisphaera sp. DSM 44207]SDQ72137.1 adenylyltransferase and sulfurtransferase [Quadrisphaera sp. DSM 44207]